MVCVLLIYNYRIRWAESSPARRYEKDYFAVMYLDNSFSTGVLKRPSAKKMVKPVSFILMAPEARSVAVVGDFNAWDPDANLLQRRIDGGWSTLVELPHGHHRYQFLVDGEPTLDPCARGTSRLYKHQLASLVAVS